MRLGRLRDLDGVRPPLRSGQQCNRYGDEQREGRELATPVGGGADRWGRHEFSSTGLVEADRAELTLDH